MLALSGYEIQTRIHNGENSVVYRGIRTTDQQSVIIKFLKETYPSPKQVSLFKREFEISHKLNLDGVVESFSFHHEQNRWAIVMEDFGGQALSLLNFAGNLSMEAFLELALALVDLLRQIHEKKIIHKNINPSNLVYNVDSRQLKLIDFGISTELSHETPTFQSPYLLEGTVSYLSPEQTGRMNRMVDYRSDFYSLGVTFYELLSGHLPFSGKDVLELIHCHLAQTPQPLTQQHPEIPQAISKIILKLLAKNAEDRYQSLYGLKSDLETCLHQWNSHQDIGLVTLGEKDRTEQFQLPDKLYGREAETQTLLDAFQKSSSGSCELVLISGNAGIGKTALVQEVYRPLTLQKGFFISGKFDQFQQNQPYACFIEMFKALIQQILTESETTIDQWRGKLRQVLGANGKVILDVIPEAETLLGEQPELPTLPPMESQNRFHRVFQNFISVFAQSDHPLVMFIDDLQWGDQGSLSMLEEFLTSGGQQSLFFIGCYRDESFGQAHPLQQTLESLRNQNITFSTIYLKPLEESHLGQWVQDTLHGDAKKNLPLAQLLLKKTGGSPFFVNEFLQFLHQNDLLVFDPSSNKWQWDLEQIQNQQITDNVVAFLTEKMKKLPISLQTILQRAASLGSTFDLKTLTQIMQRPFQEMAEALWQATQSGILLPLGDHYKYVAFSETEPEITIEYKFAHDRIQQTLYQLSPETERRAIHYQIGQSLLQSNDPSLRESNVFDFIHHLNLGREVIVQDDQKKALVKYNLVACQKAKKAAAFQSAYQYAQVGIDMLSPLPNIWETNEDLAKAIYQEGAEMACLVADYDSMERCVSTILKNIHTPLDRTKAHEIRIQADTIQNEHSAAVKESLAILANFKISFPDNPTFEDIQAAIQVAKALIGDESPERLIDLPTMEDPEKLAAMRILEAAFYSSWTAAPLLSILISIKCIELSIKYGNSPISVGAYLYFGVSLHPLLNDIDLAFAFSNLSEKLAKKLEVKTFTARTILLNFYFLRHWKKPLSHLIDQFREGIQVGLEMGNYTDTANCAFSQEMGIYHQGTVALPKLHQRLLQTTELLKNLKQTAFLLPTFIYQQAVLNWMGKASVPWELKGDDFHEDRLSEYIKNDDGGILLIYPFVKGMLCYHFQQYPLAIDNLAKTLSNQKVIGHVFLPIATMYQALAHLAIYPNANKENQSQLLKTAQDARDQLKQWAGHCATNYQHRYLLLEAELARVEGNAQAARDFYDQAIDAARQQNYYQEDALACELAGKFYLEQKQNRVAYYYLRESHYAYQQWGATAKVIAMEEAYPQLLIQKQFSRKNQQTSISSTTGTTESQNLDFESVLKSSQALSENLNLEKLLIRMLGLMIENAGAQKGVLLLKRHEDWIIEAQGTMDQKVEVQLLSIPLESDYPLPRGMLNYMIQTHEAIVQGNTFQEGIYRNDPYVQAQQLKSVLCQPIFRQGELIGILYLENNLIPEAFTEDRLEVLNILSAQIAISLENASLYTNLEEKVEQRTAELRFAQEKLLELEREATEKQMAGGFAHEMKNSLLGPKLLLDELLGMDKADSPISQNIQNLQALKQVHDAFEEQLYQTEFADTLLSMKTMSNNFEDSEKRLGLIHSSVSRAMKITNQILDYSKIGHETEEVESVELNELLQSIVDEHQTELEERAIPIHLYFDKPIQLNGQRPHFHTVFNNLLVNAKDAIKKEEGAYISIATHVDSEMCQIAISDMGVGIPETNLDQIYDAFFSTKPATGTGLGLGMVKKIVSLYQGTIEVQSKLGKGSTFTVSLPLS